MNKDEQPIMRAKPSDMICRRTAPAVTVADCTAIVQAEYEYWKQASGDVGLSAMGATANILCAINGLRAPWHPNPPLTDAEKLHGATLAEAKGA